MRDAVHRRILWGANLLLLVVVLPGCSAVQSFFAWLGPPETGATNTPLRESSLLHVAPTVRPMLDRLLPAAQLPIHEADLTVQTTARYKRRLTVSALAHPWDGLIHLERQGLLVAELAEGGAINLP